ncbi:hypothetical protein RRG08_053985 [Elysia crispata]|uniref:Uncharacterized protein n=1 Tax=Elysia crispata TaxID=231223 RepID=A0AAE1BB33_9GAST|nr:hypothetical protein RRG08_053985 [Elysia crispata]
MAALPTANGTPPGNISVSASRRHGLKQKSPQHVTSSAMNGEIHWITSDRHRDCLGEVGWGGVGWNLAYWKQSKHKI